MRNDIQLEQIVKYCRRIIFDEQIVSLCIDCHSPVNLEDNTPYIVSKEEFLRIQSMYTTQLTVCSNCEAKEEYDV